MKLKNLKLTALLFIVLLLAACGSAQEEESGDDDGESSNGDVRLTIGTGGTSGTYYPLGVAMAQQVFEGVEGVSGTNAVSTGASVANAQEMGAGDYQLALVQNDIAYYAVNGETLADFEGEPIENIAGMTSLYPEDIQLVTPADSDIETIEDLEGKNVAVGDQGSGAEANANQVLEAAGLTYDDITAEFLGFGDASQGMQNDTIDAAFIVAGSPTAAIQELGANRDIRVVSLSDDLIDTLTSEYSYYTERTISGEEYADYGQEEDIQTVAVMAILVIDSEVPEETAYNMTKALFENQSELEDAHARGADMTLETATEGMSIDLHPGVARYFEEEGISVD
ncbi:TRAP transporter TAXI family solute receptor [Virgibacillus natechei]|uniref:TRAP transporter TAXI family solute receptor n=1 Tax=Virgibacillus natechei TaxID=1216297 RepID=A0ABS4IJ59_9BACI|nr:TAXI family TRAP transporter solute-binding subunit [Virgibacillus natechei]MBP1970962.1 TRAP transporter TAXI family solute receptor [Virgibacillus natechei]UZD12730.1 TAXI family TRAP transporter solute-binding subunit [Virgibacillus natechei]